GPGSEHEVLVQLVNAPDAAPQVKKDHQDMLRLMNPHKATSEELDPKTPKARRTLLYNARMQRIDDACQKCHDSDNDVHWKFDKRWPEIIHMNPLPRNNGAGVQKAN